MTELLVGGGLGAVLAALGMGFLLWRESRKAARVPQLEQALASTRSLASVLRALCNKKEGRIRELETQLAAVDPGQLLDGVFSGPKADPK